MASQVKHDLSLMQKIDIATLALLQRIFGYQHVSRFAVRFIYLPMFVVLASFICFVLVLLLLSYKVAVDLKPPVATFFAAYTQQSPTLVALFHPDVRSKLNATDVSVTLAKVKIKYGKPIERRLKQSGWNSTPQGKEMNVSYHTKCEQGDLIIAFDYRLEGTQYQLLSVSFREKTTKKSPAPFYLRIGSPTMEDEKYKLPQATQIGIVEYSQSR